MTLMVLHVIHTFASQIECVSDGQRSRDLKILVLIIASDQDSIYRNLQKLWKIYMHYDPAHVEAYFIKGNSHLKVPFMIEDDVIWLQSAETWVPGIINKTILAMEAMLPHMNEFDYVVRTNLSSFYVFERLLKFLETCPKKGFYGGSDTGDPAIGSGCGYILSPDLVELLVNNKQFFMNNGSAADDQLVGMFLKDQGIKLVYHNRVAFPALESWRVNKCKIPDYEFHFRLKNVNHDDELYIYAQLIKMFYAVSREPAHGHVLFFNKIMGSLMASKMI